MSEVVIVDLGLGNLGSIQNMLRKIGTKAEITSDLSKIRESQKIILPGVGSYDTGVRALNDTGIKPLLDDLVLIKKVPILGICLGAQLMTQRSEEGISCGLGWFEAETVKFKSVGEKKLLLPNIGWQDVSEIRKSRLFEEMYVNPRFYFVHTYYLKPVHPEDVILESSYNIPYAVGLERDNIVGVQFHPEKSHKYGLKLLSNFISKYQ